MSLPPKYVQRLTMLAMGFDRVACRKCAETRWWLWRRGDDVYSCTAALVCCECGHISQEFTMSVPEGMAVHPD